MQGDNFPINLLQLQKKPLSAVPVWGNVPLPLYTLLLHCNSKAMNHSAATLAVKYLKSLVCIVREAVNLLQPRGATGRIPLPYALACFSKQPQHR